MTRALGRRALSWVVASILVAAPAAGLQVSPAASESGLTELAARDALRTTLEASLTPEQAAARLAGLGPSVLPAVFEALVDGRRPEDPNAYADSPPETLTPSEEEALVRFARRLGRSVVGDFLAERAAGGLSAREQVVALQLLGELGRAAELALAGRVVLSGTDAVPDRSVQTALRLAVEAVLLREPACLVELHKLVLGAELTACRGSLLRAVAVVPSPTAIAFFGDLLEVRGGDVELTRAVLAELGRAGSRVRAVDDERTRARVRALLGVQTEAQVLREAAIVAGRLGDHEAVPALVALLEHDARGVRDDAYWSVTRLTGLRLPAAHEAWRRWLVEESRWFENEAPALFQRLEQGPAGEVARALNEIARHGLYRSRLSREAERALAHPDPGVRRLACSVVAQLGACSDPGRLVALVDDPSTAVSEAAWSALRSLTGWSLPRDADLWAGAFLAGAPDGQPDEPTRITAPQRATPFAKL